MTGYENLYGLLERATPEDITEGSLAYERYHTTLQRFARYYGFGIVPTTEAFAALSPNNDYHGNLRSLAGVLDHVRHGRDGKPRVSTYGACAERAISYVRGDVSFVDTVKGQKITAFRHNLLYPATSKEVTVDGHMYLAWSAKTGTMKDAAAGISSKLYAQIARDVAHLAKTRKMLPHQMQAVLWITRKRSLDIKMPKQPSLFNGFDDLGLADVRPEDYLPYS